LSTAINQERNSVQDDVVKVLDNSYIEFAIYSLFYIDITNFIKVKATLAKEFHIQPSELDKMPAWEYSMFIQEINALVKEENEKQQKEMDKSGYNKKMTDPKYAQKMANKNMSSMKMPNMPKVSMPKF
jgi:hypothetical protein